MKLRTILLSGLLSLSFNSFANEFRDALFEQLKNSHVEVTTYKEAKTYILGHLFLQSTEGNEHYFIETSYCGDFNGGKNFGPGQLPPASQMNIDHVWAQTDFSSQDKMTMKKDLFNMLPVSVKTNVLKSNKPFGYVELKDNLLVDCDSKASSITFEPRNEIKGDVARIMFYMATRYNLEIDDKEEAVLREWHLLDPVSRLEKDLNDRIYQIQGNRNPFIDFSQFVDLVDNF